MTAAPLRDMAKPAPRSEDAFIAIDPGHVESAYVFFEDGAPAWFGKADNEEVLKKVREMAWCGHLLVIEQIACMGMAVGAEVFETVFWSGRFCEASTHDGGPGYVRVKRHEVKAHLCGNQRAKDANIRAALIDRYGPGRELAIGKKKTPGPLYGVAADVWQALAVAVTFADRLPAPRREAAAAEGGRP